MIKQNRYDVAMNNMQNYIAKLASIETVLAQYKNAKEAYENI